MVFVTGRHPRGARASSSSGKSSNRALGKSWESMSSQFDSRYVIIKKKVNKLTMGSVTKGWRQNVNLGLEVGLGKAAPWQLLKIVCSGIPVVVFHTLYEGIAWLCSLFHGHAPFWKEYGWGLFFEDRLLEATCVILFIFYTCLCCEPNLYLKSWYSLSILYWILLHMSWLVTMM